MENFEQILSDLSDLTIIVRISIIIILPLSTIYLKKNEISTAFVVSFCLSTLGATAGYNGGLSREAAVAAIIPGALSLIGGISIYVFGLNRDGRLIAPIVALAFSLSLYTGYSSGAYYRVETDRESRLTSFCYQIFENPQTISNDLNFYRYFQFFSSSCFPIFANDAVKFLDIKQDKELGVRHDILSDFYNLHCENTRRLGEIGNDFFIQYFNSFETPKE